MSPIRFNHKWTRIDTNDYQWKSPHGPEMKDIVAIFDADGVFLRTTQPGNYLEYRYGLPAERTAGFYQALGPCLTGKADLRELLPDYLKQWGITESADEFLEGAFGSGTEIDPDVAKVVAELRKQGVTCCLATNQDKHRMTYLDRLMNIRACFDAVFVSCELGTKKPERAFYDLAGQQFPGRTLAFWDDKLENVTAAEKCGWTAYVFTDVATLRSDIVQLTRLPGKL